MSNENPADLSAENFTDNANDTPTDTLADPLVDTLAEELQEIDEAELAESLNQLNQQPADKLPTSPDTDTQFLKDQVASLTAENDTLQQQLTDAKEQYRRLYADFDNYRKRVDRDKQEVENRLAGKFLDRLLPVLDDFERAQSQINPKNDGEAVIHRSYQSIYKHLQKFIKDAGVIKLETVGKPFDPNFHEAIAQEPSPDYEENTVCAELRGGYLLGERVLRPALVKVSSAKINPDNSSDQPNP